MITILTKPIPINQKYGLLNGRLLLTKKYRTAKNRIAWEIKSQYPHPPVDKNVSINIVQYFGDKRNRDCDAYIKILLDAAEGILYKNDVQVTELHVFKEYSKTNPRIIMSML